MARIDKRLLKKIAEKKGVTEKAVYPLVSKVMQETFLERDLAALVLASRLNVSFAKYSTSAQREQIRGYLAGAPVDRTNRATTQHVEQPVISSSRKSRRTASNRKPQQEDNSVFVIHGRDLVLRDSMFAFLSALGCKPIEFHQAVARVRGKKNPFVGDVLDAVFKKAQALVVLFSPDDEVKLKDHFVKRGERSTEGKLRSQARANVIFEAGMAFARHEEKTIMVQVGDIKTFSDVAGRHMVHLDDSFESRNDFVGRLEKLCKIDRTGSVWVSVKGFSPTSPKSKRKRRTNR